jgi:glycosyltransferase involved in cell wall biosynthesis
MTQAYSRNRLSAERLAASGWRIAECRVDPRLDLRERIRGFRGLRFFVRSGLRQLRQWAALLRRHARLGPYDVLLVGYPAHADVFPAALLAALRRRPLVMDAFYGLYDTVVADRGLAREGSLLAGMVRIWEWIALRLPDRVLIDTEEQAAWLAALYALPRERVAAIPVGIDESIWRPRPLPPPGSEFRVALWATFIPLHGVEVVIRAAKLLEKSAPSARLEIAGDGQTADAVAALRDALRPRNLSWRRVLLPMTEVAELAARAHCCLGIVGSTDKSQRVIPYKVYQALASARPVITADTAASRRVLEHERSALLVPTGDPQALADAIARLARDPPLCQGLAEGGRRAYERHMSAAVLQERLDRVLRRLVAERGARRPGPETERAARG